MECAHNIITSNGDAVCTRCGVATRVEQAEAAVSGESRTNLYQDVAVGSATEIPRMRQTEALRMYFHGTIRTGSWRKSEETLSRFSNACERLRLPKAASSHAWRLFCKAIPGKSSRKTAETACWAIYESCRAHCIPDTAEEITRAVKISFGRERLPHMITILYENSDRAPSIPEDRYYFEINWKKMCGRQDQKRRAWYLYQNVYTQGNRNSRARAAIRAVLAR